jgi:hypothetical protein
VTVVVQVNLPDHVYRALVRTSVIRGLPVHKIIETGLIAATTGVTPGERHRQITKAEEGRWVALWRRGWTDSQIAREAGRRQNVVSRHLRALGCAPHGKGGARTKAASSMEQEVAA